MTYLRLDDNFAEHPKVAVISDAAFRVHVRGLCYASRHLTDGDIPAVVAEAWGRKGLDELVKRDLWLKVGAVYSICGYLDWNASKAEILDRRRKDSERKRSGSAFGFQAERRTESAWIPGVGVGEGSKQGIRERRKRLDRAYEVLPKEILFPGGDALSDDDAIAALAEFEAEAS